MEKGYPTIGSVSRQILKNFTKKARIDGGYFWGLGENIDWQHHIVRGAYGDRRLGPQHYDSLFKILLEIYVADNDQQAEDFLSEIEPYSEVPKLTAWLHASDRHVHYLNRALKINQFNDGVTLLSEAHKLFLQDVGTNLIKAISQHIAQQAVYVNSLP